YRMFRQVTALLKHAISWQLASARDASDLSTRVERYREPAQRLLAQLPEYMSGAYERRWQAAYDAVAQAGIDAGLATRMASASVGGGLLGIAALADSKANDVATVARIYFCLGSALGLAWLHQAIQNRHVDGRWPALARSSLRGDCYRVHQRLTAQVLASGGDLQAWRDDNADDIAGVHARIEELQAVEVPTFAHLTVAVRDLAHLHDGR